MATTARRQRASESGGAAQPVQLTEEAPVGGPPPGEFWDVIDSVAANDQWPAHVCYVYRLQPAISQKGRSFIEKRDSPFDESDLLETWGSGEYLLILKNHKTGPIAKHSVSVYDQKKPPILDLSLLATNCDPKWKALLLSRADKETAAADRGESNQAAAIATRESAPTQDSNQAATAAINSMAGIARAVLQQKESDPALAGRAGVVDDTMLRFFLESAKSRDDLAAKLAANSGGAAAADPLALLDRVLGIAEKINRPQQQAAAADPFESMDRFMDLLNKAKSFSSEGTPAEPQMWERLLDRIGPVVAPAISAFVTAKLAPAPARPAPGQQPAQSQQAYPQQVYPQPAPEQDPTASSPAPQALPAGVASRIDPQVEIELAQLVQRIMPALTTALQSGKSGEEFGDWLVEGEGMRNMGLLKQIGPHNLLGLVERVYPQLVEYLAPIRPRIEEFAAELCGWEPQAEDEAAEGEESPVADREAAPQ